MTAASAYANPNNAAPKPAVPIALETPKVAIDNPPQSINAVLSIPASARDINVITEARKPNIL